jgi:hypothetical protein
MTSRVYKKVKTYYQEKITKLKSQFTDLDDFLKAAVDFTYDFTNGGISKHQHNKSQRLVRYYLTQFYNSEEELLSPKFFPRCKYYFGLSARAENRFFNINRYNVFFNNKANKASNNN